MQSKNYYCNDEIDRGACPLYYDEKKDTYKIGKHKVPSLNEIVSTLTGRKENRLAEKKKIISYLHHFLLTGIKEKPIVATFDKTQVYAQNLNTWLDTEGYYKKETPKEVIKHFTYNKKIELENEEPFSAYINCLQKEIEVNSGNPHHLIEIEGLERYFHSEHYVNSLTKQTAEYKTEELIAWFSSFEKLEQFHYHLAKKQSKRENLYFASQIDITTKDTLYYITTNEYFSLSFVSLYLNLQNIDLKKENLIALIIYPIGTVESVVIQKISEEELDDLIQSYKNKNVLKYFNENAEIDYRIKKNISFFKEDYIKSLIPNDITEKPLGFALCELINGIGIIKEEESVKENRVFILEGLIISLKIIKKVAKEYSVEYALLCFERLKNLFRVWREKDYFQRIKKYIGSDCFFNNFITKTKTQASKLGQALNFSEKRWNEEGIQEVKYQDVTLDLKLTEKQKNALLYYLNTNLITSDETNSKGKDIKLKQIIDIKEKKRLSTLNNTQVNFTGLYKKASTYYGCTRSDKYLSCEIVDVRIFHKEKKEDESTLSPYPLLLVVDILEIERTERNEEISLTFEIINTKDLKQLKLSENEIEEINKKIKLSNERLTLFFDTFSIKRGEFNFSSWLGKKGIVAVATDKLSPKGEPCFVQEKGKGVLYVEEEELNK